MNKDVECPYCGKEQDICHDDGYGYSEGEKHQQQCGYCNKTFVFETSISFYYDVEKADCLNGGEHDFKPTVTFPKEYTKMQCSMCDASRLLTDEEKKLYNIPSINPSNT